MKRILLVTLVLGGCQTTLDPNYALQLESYRLTISAQQSVEIAKANAEAARYAAMAAIAERADGPTKSMAIFALAMSRGGEASTKPVEVHLPRIPETQEDRALKWATVFAGPTTALVSSYFGYQLGKVQSNNQAQTTQASYAALVAFKPQPIDWSKIPGSVSNIITTTTNTTTDTRNDTDITNRDGNVNVGVGAPANQDNSPIAIVPPVVVVPPVVPIVPVVTTPVVVVPK
jgi:hypothetical protein